MSSTVLKSTVSKRRLIMSDTQQGLTNKEVEQTANVIPFDAFSRLFPLKAQADPEALDFIVDTQELPLYVNFDFNKIGHDSKQEITVILQGVEYPCTIKRESDAPASTFFKQNFVLYRR